MSKKQDQKIDEELNQTIGKLDEDQKQSVEGEVKLLTSQILVLEDQLKRAVADYHNLEKRTREDALSIVSFARAELIRKLLPILDNLEQSVEGAKMEQSGWLKGVEIAVKQMKQVLMEEGVEEIDSTGEFNPSLHEAVDTTQGEEGRILKIIAKGYKLNGRIIRPAKVVVGKDSKGE